MKTESGVKMELHIGLTWNSIFHCKPVRTNSKLSTLYTERINIPEGSQPDHDVNSIFQHKVTYENMIQGVHDAQLCVGQH